MARKSNATHSKKGPRVWNATATRKLNATQLRDLASLLVLHNRLDEQLYMYGEALFRERWAAARDPCHGERTG